MPTKKYTILIVEDEMIVAKDIEIKLKTLGYGLAGHATSGEKAIGIIEKKQPDLILMDIMLQGDMSGIEVAEHIQHLNIPVIYITAYSDKGTLATAKVTAPYGYIVKPFTEIDLKTNIEIALHKNQSDRNLINKRDATFQLIHELNDSSHKNLFVRNKSVLLKIAINDILFIEALQDYVIIWTLKKKFIVHSTMKGIDSLLPNKLFQRVHRSFIVKMDAIDEIKDNTLRLNKLDKEVPISKTYKKDLINRLDILD